MSPQAVAIVLRPLRARLSDQPRGWPKVAWLTRRDQGATAGGTLLECSQRHTPSAGPMASNSAMTASISAVPAEASGTFKSLCKVLCILQSLYLCAIGPMSSMLPCDGYTSRFKLQSQATLLLDPGNYIWLAKHTAPYGTVSLCCGPFQVAPWCPARPRHSRPVLCPQHLLKPQ